MKAASWSLIIYKTQSPRICEYQVRLLKISGKCVFMDSKLIGSNIARQSRYVSLRMTTQVRLNSNYAPF